MSKSLFVAGLLLLSYFSNAAIIAPPQLIKTQNAEIPIQLKNFSVNTEVSGTQAETHVSMEFFNPNKRNLEGELQFPLRSNQQIKSFSLDINGKMRAAVPVEKTKGRQVFEEIERKSVDPGILEQTQGNNFKLRIYPIGSMNSRKVEIVYIESLEQAQENLIYRLPLSYGEEVQNFDLSINLKNDSAVPKLVGKDLSSEMEFKKVNQGYSLTLHKNNYQLNKEIALAIPATQSVSQTQQVFKDKTYFFVEQPLSATPEKNKFPSKLTLLWDASGSGATRNHTAELKFLEAYFQQVKNIDVRLIRLRNKSDAPENFSVRDGQWDELYKKLQSTIYDGATHLGDWVPDSTISEYWLFSDGLENFGTPGFPQLKLQQRLVTISASTTSDDSHLQSLAENNNGLFIHLDNDQIENALHSVLSQRIRASIVKVRGAEEVLLDNKKLQQNYLSFAGQFTDDTAQVILNVQYGDQTQEIKLNLSKDLPVSSFPAYAWASLKLNQLNGDYDLHKAEVRRIGQNFSIPTRDTSLIVLDNINDYIRYDIAPPEELRDEFYKIKSAQISEAHLTKQKHLDDLVNKFNGRILWWEKDFPKNDLLPPTVDKKSALAPVAVAAPAPSVEPVRSTVYEPAAPRATNQIREAPARERSEEVVVTGARVAAPTQSIRRNSASVVDSVTAEDVGSLPDRGVSESLQRMPGVKIDRESKEAAAPVMQIQLKKWTPDAPYIQRIKSAAADKIYHIYLDEKPSYLNSSAFYLDVADVLLEKGQTDLSLRVLSNIAEMNLENQALLRILGYRLWQMKMPDLAIPIFVKVQQIAPDEPQSYRDLGLVYATARQYQLAIEQLNQVIEKEWNGRFADIELIAIAELNAVIAKAAREKIKVDVSMIDPRLLKNLPLDLRVVLTWDANDSDMDLWVTDPNNEKCFYGHNETYQGGHMSRDFTQGYGPEEFSLKKAKPGKYKVEANFYGNRQQIVAGATSLQLTLITGFGTEKEKEQKITLRLTGKGETVFVGEFEVK